ncbi:MAG: hypothetical protein PUA95_08285 [Lactimicrobium massiliense]|nr:hypothetical protein [Lactimicrobium massiliense]MDD6230718.1 hypothetical protein [Lactimicrobium massiliense]MDD6726877.1 hypothetical protein [Lactimicrobium massiliense]
MIHVERKDGKILCEINGHSPDGTRMKAENIYEEMFALNLAIMEDPVLQLLWEAAAAKASAVNDGKTDNVSLQKVSPKEPGKGFEA